MTTRAREREEVVNDEIEAAGGRILDRYKDGGEHNVVKFTLNGYTAEFHYQSSAGTKGCRMLNMRARLRRKLAEIKARPPRIPIERSQPSKQGLFLPLAQPTPPKGKVDRKEMIKSYLTMDSIGQFMETYDLTRAQAEIMLLSSRGQAADKLRKEINLERAQKARAIREAMPAVVEQIEKSEPVKRLRAKPIKRTYAIGKAKEERDHRIRTYCQYGVTLDEAAGIFKLSVQQVRRIVGPRSARG